MSALLAHVKSLRAEAKALRDIVQLIVEGKQSAMPATYETLCALRDAKLAAADDLEQQMKAQLP